MTNITSTARVYVSSHLTMSAPDAAYAIELLGSSYHNKQPVVSDFGMISPNLRGEKPLTLRPWDQKGSDALFFRLE